MFDVVNLAGGTAGIARLADVDVGGKTGTAQNPHGKDHAWFVCFAPVENPQIALAVFVENSGFGGAVSAPIAVKLLDAFFHNNKYEEFKNPLKHTIAMPDTSLKANVPEEIPD